MTAATTFRALHESASFVLPNPWDVGTARYLAHLGFKALATTSAGVAFSRGRPDTARALPLADMLAHIRDVVAATPLPVNADFQGGYADEPEGVAANVAACVATGVGGLSIEDNSGRTDDPLYERSLAIARIRAARAAIDATGVPVVLTARCEAWLVGAPDAERTVFDRLVAFADAGADCLYAPGVKDLGVIARLVKLVAPRPLNVLVGAAHAQLAVARLTEIGVRRISVGSALARVAWGGFMRAANEIAEHGTFTAFAGAASFDELNGLFSDS